MTQNLSKQSLEHALKQKNQGAGTAKLASRMATRSEPQTIAIVGGGFSGSMVAVHLLRYATAPLQIHLVEKRSPLGQGLAYSTSVDCHLLNVPAAKMSAFADEPNHFVEWLQHRGLCPLPFAATDFVPRKLYGRYIQSVLQAAETNAPAFVSLKWWTDEAIAVTSEGAQTKVELQSGLSLKADRVVLALGNFAPSPPMAANSAFCQSDRYLSSAWSPFPWHQLPCDASVLLVGSGLTALDVVMTLHQQKHRGPIHLVSRHGLLPQVHRPVTSYPLLPDPTASDEHSTSSVRGLMRWLRLEIALAAAQGTDWRAVIDALRPATQKLWRSLSAVEKRRFLRHVRPYWEVHRHRMAPAIAQVVEALRAADQLQIHAGRIQAFHDATDKVCVVVRERGGVQKTLWANLIVNCTGPACDYRKIQHPLVAQLLSTGQVRPCPYNLGLEVTAEGAIVGESGVSTHLYTLGSAQKGQYWETTAVPEIRKQAQQLAHKLLEVSERVPYYSALSVTSSTVLF